MGSTERNFNLYPEEIEKLELIRERFRTATDKDSSLSDLTITGIEEYTNKRFFRWEKESEFTAHCGKKYPGELSSIRKFLQGKPTDDDSEHTDPYRKKSDHLPKDDIYKIKNRITELRNRLENKIARCPATIETASDDDVVSFYELEILCTQTNKPSSIILQKGGGTDDGTIVFLCKEPANAPVANTSTPYLEVGQKITDEVQFYQDGSCKIQATGLTQQGDYSQIYNLPHDLKKRNKSKEIIEVVNYIENLINPYLI